MTAWSYYNRDNSVRAPRFILFLSILTLGASAASARDAWKRVQMTHELRWGADATGGAPYVFPDPKNPSHLIGFEVDVMQALGRKMKMRTRLVLVPWDELVPALLRDDFDVAFNGLEITPDRLQVINFTIPYYVFSEQITARAGDLRCTKFADLETHRVGTLTASLAYTLLVRDHQITPVAYPSPVEAYKDLEIGRVDAVLMDDVIAAWYAGSNPKLANVGTPVGQSTYGGGVRKDSPELRVELNQAISQLIQSGELEAIYRKWNIWTPAQATLHDTIREKKMNADLSAWTEYLPLLLKGAVVTVLISFLSMSLAICGGFLLCLGKLYGIKVVQKLASGYIEIIRGTPLLIQLYLLYYGLPNLGIQLNAFVAAVIGMGMNYAAYEAEIYRAGLLSIPKGQWEAARSIGMTQRQCLRHIIVPQAVRTILPPSTNDFIALFKDTSIVSILTVTELTRAYSTAATATYRFLELGLVTAVLYFAMSYPLARWSRALERKQHATFH
jgi:polar amino acid transport system substrate-binding protein